MEIWRLMYWFEKVSLITPLWSDVLFCWHFLFHQAYRSEQKDLSIDAFAFTIEYNNFLTHCKTNVRYFTWKLVGIDSFFMAEMHHRTHILYMYIYLTIQCIYFLRNAKYIVDIPLHFLPRACSLKSHIAQMWLRLFWKKNINERHKCFGTLPKASDDLLTVLERQKSDAFQTKVLNIHWISFPSLSTYYSLDPLFIRNSSFTLCLCFLLLLM